MRREAAECKSRPEESNSGMHIQDCAPRLLVSLVPRGHPAHRSDSDPIVVPETTALWEISARRATKTNFPINRISGRWVLEGLHRLGADIQHISYAAVHKSGSSVWQDLERRCHPLEMRKLLDIAAGHITHRVNVVVVVSARRVRCGEE